MRCQDLMEKDHKETAPEREGVLENVTTTRTRRRTKNPSAESDVEENPGEVDEGAERAAAVADRDSAVVDAAGVTDSHVLQY